MLCLLLSCVFCGFWMFYFLYSKQNQFDFGVLGSAVPLYTRSKQACSYKAFTRQSCPTFSLCESAAGLRCIIHEHSVNLLIQNMSSLFLCLIYYLSFFFCFDPVIPSRCSLLCFFFSFLYLLFPHQDSIYSMRRDSAEN